MNAGTSTSNAAVIERWFARQLDAVGADGATFAPYILGEIDEARSECDAAAPASGFDLHSCATTALVEQAQLPADVAANVAERLVEYLAGGCSEPSTDDDLPSQQPTSAENLAPTLSATTDLQSDDVEELTSSNSTMPSMQPVDGNDDLDHKDVSQVADAIANGFAEYGISPSEALELFESTGFDQMRTFALLLEFVEQQQIQEEAGESPHRDDHLADNTAQFAASSDTQTPSSSILNDRPPICTFFLTDQCRRADCWFSHDLTEVQCRFWLAGRCHKGAACPFLHGVGSGAASKLSASAAQALLSIQRPNALQPQSSASLAPAQAPTIASEQEFPALGGVRPLARKQPSPARPAVQVESLGSKLKLHALQACYPSLAPWDIREAFERADCNQSATERALDAQFPEARVLQSSPAQQSDEQARASRLQRQHTSSTRRVAFPIGAASRSALAWVSTGADLRDLYQSRRQQAADLAVERNKLLVHASNAFKSGDGRSAASLSAKARDFDRQMQRLHSEAADAIFAERNPNLIVQNGTVALDVHGLHIGEAVDMVERFLLAPSTPYQWVQVITGTGHHSAQSRAKLLPALKAFCSANSYQYREHGMNDGRGGVVLIRVPTSLK
ncbi:hypothetical protein CAOG_00508 [Capsaspora owczarzaki ATCC 30864]|uniref:Smr domain-containing protein n=1 Tax=Capsaspora owczarzaki (strain ATCC 30864) TaxID=595528 RepID=A0A0D2WH90_CAPO3|nr:hypothetical protein CAOG_00508 [Capsaspora owczarzaki ATCC 30864]KJE88940.1 hypothetical protein CAOG_000508 [Capsaspora owczarzaki ATCC 30864]|eukprot:XP_004365379.1 hypothetical protein CAOG_00508 [Capsaspora owczarzaki ATCC 30864]